MIQKPAGYAVRLDQYVISQMPDLSRTYATKLIEAGKVRVNDQVYLKAGYKLRTSDSVLIDFDATILPDIPDISLEVIYDDDDCIVINKPVGLLIHSKGAFNSEATVATWLARKLADGISVNRKPSNNIDSQRNGIVHRLDRATSGVMICAKNPESLLWLQKQFSKRNVKKSYVAIVRGQLENKEAIIEMALERNPKKPQTFRVGSNGKPSTTHFTVTDSNHKYSLLDLKPTTGRTHQLRVHLSYLGHPIVGDTLYGGESAERLFLHAQSLELTLPSRKRQLFYVSLPKIFNDFMKSHE